MGKEKYTQISAPRIATKKSPKELLDLLTPGRQWPISGGWGYTKEDALAINAVSEADGVAVEQQFIECRAIIELRASRPEGSRYDGIKVEKGDQFLIHRDGIYDKVQYTVTAIPENDFALLQKEWKDHNGFKGDIDGMIKFDAQMSSKIVSYETVCYYEISGFFGKF